MPLVRLKVRNEYGLGQPELYRETNREDPKAVLDGVAVAGLVGILRQLGDLADFAAEVFHGLQGQVMTTASRSHKLMVRVQNIEASLPPLEKAVLAQRSHIHLAYTAGCEWHPRIKPSQNHFIYNDLPQFIMDSYEECRDPPRVHLLDKFDIGGPGSCLRRYSDPTFFKRASADSDESSSEKTERARKTHKNKKKRSSRRNGELLWGEQMRVSSDRMQFISPTVNGRTSSSQTASAIDLTVKSDLEDHSNSFDSRAGAGYIECVFHPINSMQSDDQDCKGSSPSRLTQKTNTLQSVSPLVDDNVSHDSLEKQIASSSSGVTWDEKEEIMKSNSQACDRDKTLEGLVEIQDSDIHANQAFTVTNIDYNDILFDEESNLKSVSSRVQTDDIDSEPDNYMDALNAIESEYENDQDYETKREVEQFTSLITRGMIENGVTEATSNLLDNNLSDVVLQTGYTVSLNKETERDLPDSPQENPPVISEPHPSNLGSVGPSDDLPSIETNRDTVSLNKETFRDLPDFFQEIPPLISESHESYLGSVSPEDVPVSSEITKDLADSHSSESLICEQVAYACGNSVLDSSVYPDSLIGAEIEPDVSFSGSKISGLLDDEADTINRNICESEETPRESSGDHSVRFWTNGGLLGLEPSKPPDFTMSNSLISQGSLTTKGDMDGDSSYNSTEKSNGYEEEQDLSAEVAEQILKEPSSGCLMSSHDDDQACISAKTPGSSQLSNGFSQTEGINLGGIRVIAPGSVVPAAPDMKACAEPNQRNGENSSRVFGLSHKLLMNSFPRKVSFDEKSGTYNSPKAGILGQSGQNGIERQSLPETKFKEQVGSEYPIDSLPPSPPLEHMKISFHPVSGLETSKLKLKFPDGSNHHESIRDMYPSFQLVPEPSIALDDLGLHSDDDDTFCRSSPFISDDCLSPRSDYNSDQWESDETPENSDHAVHDSPHKRSSTEPMLSTKELGGVYNVDINVASGHSTYNPTGVKPLLSGPLLDFPSFDKVNPILEQESNKHSKCNNVVMSQSHAEPTPPPPPLPPKQWQGLKPQLDMINGTRHCMPEYAEEINDPSHSESTFFQQPRLTEVEQTQINHDDHDSHDNILHNLKDKLDQQELNGQREANQVRMGKEMDEREDFLHQIRTKSFNLRRTVTGKPNANTRPTTSVKVTAILKKANAIRQVVASDDGEDDDNWSDT